MVQNFSLLEESFNVALLNFLIQPQMKLFGTLKIQPLSFWMKTVLHVAIDTKTQTLYLYKRTRKV